MNRPVQLFSDEYLMQCRTMSSTAIAQFLEDFRQLNENNGAASKSILISLKVPQNLLATFRARCLLERIPYQTKIKQLMRASLNIAE